MKCPLNNISILFIQGKVLRGGEYEKIGDTKTGFFSTTYGTGQNAYGFWNYKDSEAVAGGGGYNKYGVLLAEVVNKEFGTNYRNSGEGENHTIRQMQADGFTVKAMYEVNNK